MVRKIFAGVALAGLMVSSYSTSIPSSISSSFDEMINLTDGTAFVLYGSDQTGLEGRYITSNMFDGSGESFYSMGFDGVVQIDLTDPRYFVDDATVIEVTWDNGGDKNHHEAAEVWWGTADGNFISGALLLNCNHDFLTNNSYIDDGWDIIGVTDETDDLMTWNATLPTNDTYTSLYIRDVTHSAFTYTTSGDGFDIGEITYASVPEPASIVLLGISMLSIFGFSYRRKK